jgi:uncharacterized protein (DUF1330 family)
MSAYVVVDLEILDPAGFEEYKKLVVPIIGNYDGKYIVAGGALETLEGDWNPKRIVVIEFPSMQRAREWFNCEEYCQSRYHPRRRLMTASRPVAEFFLSAF